MKVSSMLGLYLALMVMSALGCTGETVNKVEAMADRACACRDAACADKVEKDFWAFAKTGQKRGTQGERDEVEGHYNRMRECIARVRSGAPAPGAASGAAADPAEAAKSEPSGSKAAGTESSASQPPGAEKGAGQ